MGSEWTAPGITDTAKPQNEVWTGGSKIDVDSGIIFT